MTQAKSPLLPEYALKPIMFLWAILVPQLLLLGINLSAWLLIRGELNPEGAGAWICVFIGQATLLSLALTAWRWSAKRKIAVGVWAATLIFVVHAAYLWMFMYLDKDLIPDSVAFWMLSDPQLVFAQFMFMTPALFYALTRLAGTPTPLSSRVDITLSLSAVVGIPLLWYLAIMVMFKLLSSFNFPEVITLLLMFACTAAMLLAFIRMLLWAYVKIGQSLILALLAALIFPLAGLALNYVIPFPCPLQDWTVYALTLLNALAVMLPFSTKPSRGLPVWLARCATYPFTLYFFLLFLPFLPLSIPAMVAAGGGFLILSPTLLFIIHTRRLYTEGIQLASRYGQVRLVLLFLLMLTVMPGLYTGRALYHKHALMQAVDAVYSPDYSSARVPINYAVAHKALRRLQDMKEGQYTPFLSEYYNRLVFNGMVLPDHKIDHLNRILFGEEPAPRNHRRRGFDNFFQLLTNTGHVRTDWENTRAAPRTVRLEEVQVTSTNRGLLTEATLALELTNGSGDAAEYRTEINLPEGVLVSGFTLDVNDLTVPGQLFDRKAAEWIYHMIRDTTRRDPAILSYSDPHTLSLKVYPFAVGETRHCSLSLLYPAAQREPVQLGDRYIQLPSSPVPAQPIRLTRSDGRSGLVLLPEVAERLPAVIRPNQLHIIADVSNAAIDTFPTYADQIKKLLAAQQADSAWLTFANFESGQTQTVDQSTDLTSLMVDLPFRGGFDANRAVAHAVIKHQTDIDTRPVLILLTGSEPSAIDQEEFRMFIPDLCVLWNDEAYAPAPTVPVLRLKCGNEEKLLAQAGGWMLFDRPGKPEKYQPETGSFIPITDAAELRPESDYALGLQNMAAWADTILQPARINEWRAPVLKRARETGILNPMTSYIVLENSAQWELLKRKERQSLQSDHALEFDEFKDEVEAPEPSFWLLLLLCGPYLLWRVLRPAPVQNQYVSNTDTRTS